MPFTWSATEGRYRDGAGVLVPEATLRRALDTIIDKQALAMRALTQGLIDGTTSLSTWQLVMQQAIKELHLVGTSLAVGGWHNLDQSDFGWVGQRVRDQYRFLNAFAQDIASGRQKLDGTVLARSELYAHAARATHRAAQQRFARERGMEQERNQLGAADHCSGCLTETSRGWVTIGSLIPCGSRNCLARCHCSLTYRTRSAA